MRVSPDRAEMIRQFLVSITEEMKTNLMRTAYNLIITESLDFTVGLFDRQGNTVSIGLGLPMFIRGMAETVKAQVEAVREEGILPGDILLTNDAYVHGSHLNHFVFTLPIFWQGEVVAYACTMAHWQDVGGSLRGRTTDIYSEGLQLPTVKIYREGRLNREIAAIIRANVRFPELAMGDFRAQVASVRTGEARYQDLCARYGVAAVDAVIAAVMDAHEAKARAVVAAIPDGEYWAESFMDDDGVVEGQRIPIRVGVRVAGEEMTVDLSQVAPQVQGYYNAGATAGRSAAQVAFKCLTTPTDWPINDGAFRPLKVVLPQGRVVSAVRPAAMRWWMTVPMTVVDTIFRALAPAIPERVIAGHHADLLSTNLFGVDPRTGRFFSSHFGSSGGGWGAKLREDGVSATICINDGDTHNRPVEMLEHRFPVVVRRYQLRPDSGGAGRWRGGLGTIRETEVLGPARLNTPIERTQCAPWGVAGGQDGLPNRLRVIRADGRELPLTSGKVDSLELEPGDRVVVESGGGGGWGPPEERPLEAVAEDLRRGYVSPEAALRWYGVRFDPDRGTVEEVEAGGRARRGSQRGG